MIHGDIKMQSAAMPVHSGVRNQEGCNSTPVTATSASYVAGGFLNSPNILYVQVRESIVVKLLKASYYMLL